MTVTLTTLDATSTLQSGTFGAVALATTLNSCRPASVSSRLVLSVDASLSVTQDLSKALAPGFFRSMR